MVHAPEGLSDGLGLARAGLRFLVAAGPGRLPRLSEISLDERALAFTVALSLLSGLLFGLIPALKYSGPASRESSKRSKGPSTSVSLLRRGSPVTSSSFPQSPRP